MKQNSAGVFGEDSISGKWMETSCGPITDMAMSIRSVSDDAAGEIMSLNKPFVQIKNTFQDDLKSSN